jgi:hypothetical protein
VGSARVPHSYGLSTSPAGASGPVLPPGLAYFRVQRALLRLFALHSSSAPLLSVEVVPMALFEQ